MVLAEKFSKGAGLRGHLADQFVNANKSLLAINEVQVLRNLFAQIYPTYVALARERFQFHSHSFRHAMGGYGKTFENATFYAWQELYPSIRVIAVDFTYQGFGKQRPLHFCMANDFQWLIYYITHTPGLNRYEKGRPRGIFAQE